MSRAALLAVLAFPLLTAALAPSASGTGPRGATVVLACSSNTQQVTPGAQAPPFTVTVNNNGDEEGEVAITLVNVPAGWTAYASPALQTVQPGQMRTTTVTITTAANTPADSYPIRVRGELVTNPSVYAETVLTVEVVPVYSVKVYAPPGLPKVVPGQVVQYTFKVENTGNSDDSFLLSAASSLGLEVQYPASTATLGPGTNQPVPVTVTVPEGEGPGTDTLTFTATSLYLPSASATGTVLTTIAQLHKVTLDPDASEASAAPGGSVEMRVKAKNGGNAQDTFTASATPPSGWTVRVQPSQFDLVVGDDEDVSVLISVPSSAKTGSYDVRVRVSASDGSDDTVLLKVRVRQTHALLLSAEDASLKGAGGNTLRFDCSIFNQGNGREVVDLRVAGEVSHWASVSPAKVELEPGAQAMIAVSVAIPITADVGSHTITLVASPTDDPSEMKELALVVEVAQRSAISLRAEAETVYMNLYASRTAAVGFTVTNLGNGQDIVLLSLAAPTTYEGSGSLSKRSLTLEKQRDYANFTLDIEFTDTAVKGSFAYTVTARSSNDQNAVASVTVRVIIVEVNLKPLASTFRVNDERVASGAFHTKKNRQVEFAFEVENEAQVAVPGPITVTLQVSGADSGTQTTTINDIQPASSALVRLSWIPAKAGTYQLSFDVDSGNAVTESDESDNQIVYELTVDPPASREDSGLPWSTTGFALLALLALTAAAFWTRRQG